MKADKKQVQRLLNTASGQLTGIQKMIEDDRYCMDISNQLLATIAILKQVNRKILQAHIECCVKDALLEGKGKEKIEEILDVVEKMSK